MDIYARVRQAASELIAEGQWPTVIDIRARLGSGSNTTINNTLKQWRQEFLSRAAVSARRPEWPPQLVEACDQLWQLAYGQAEAQLETARQQARDEVARLVAELADAQRALLTADGQLQAQQQACGQLQAELAACRQQLAEETQRRQVLEEGLAGLAASLDEARLQVQQSQQEADERVQALEQRHEVRLQQAAQDAERREALAYERFEGVRVQLYQQVDAERAKMRQQEAQWLARRTQLSDELDALRQQQRQHDADAAREQGRLQAQAEALAAQLQQALAELVLLRQQDAVRQEQLLQLHAELAAQRGSRAIREQQWQDWLLRERQTLAAMSDADCRAALELQLSAE